MCNIRDNESMVVNFFRDKFDTVSATAGSSRIMISTESHHIIVGTKHSLLDCRIIIDIVNISKSRIVFLRPRSAYIAMEFREAHGVEGE